MGIKGADLRPVAYFSDDLAVFYSLQVVCLLWGVWEM